MGLDNFGNIVGNISLSAGSTVTPTIANESTGNWTLTGNSSVSGSALSNAGTINSEAASTLSGLASLTNTGTIEADGFVLSIGTSGAAITNSGTFEVANGILTVGDAVAGTGSAVIDNDGLLSFQSNVASTQTVTFTGSADFFTHAQLAYEIFGFRIPIFWI